VSLAEVIKASITSMTVYGFTLLDNADGTGSTLLDNADVAWMPLMWRMQDAYSPEQLSRAYSPE